jgi:putative ABC transport system substrate-binding protein
MSVVAYLHNRAELNLGWEQTPEAAARELGIKVLLAEHTPTNYADAFALIARERGDALLVASSNANFGNRRLIAEFAAKAALPAVYGYREVVDAGGLISYGPDVADLLRRMAGYADRILKGANPADLTFEQPTKFLLTINLKTAKALGLAVPPSLLARADEVIE